MKGLERFSENVPGKYYVTQVCIGCTLCAEIAPLNFKENTDLDLAVGHSYVYRQPHTDEEKMQCKEALDACPSNAINDDGAVATAGSRPCISKTGSAASDHISQGYSAPGADSQ